MSDMITRIMEINSNSSVVLGPELLSGSNMFLLEVLNDESILLLPIKKGSKNDLNISIDDFLNYRKDEHNF